MLSHLASRWHRAAVIASMARWLAGAFCVAAVVVVVSASLYS
jgi:hypothetical protein